MASIVLALAEAKSGTLPALCTRCGGDDARFHTTRLEHLGSRITLNLPLCRAHRNHFRWRAVCFGTGLVLGVILLCISLWELSPAKEDEHFRGSWQWLFSNTGLFLILGSSIFLTSVIAVFVLWFFGVHVRALDQYNVTLAGVAPEFVEAVHAGRHSDVLAIPATALPAISTVSVVLSRDEAKLGALPALCMRCGRRSRAFYGARLHYWAGSMVGQFPLCEWHKNHWAWRVLCLRLAALAGVLLPWVWTFASTLEAEALMLGGGISRLLVAHPLILGFVVLVPSVLLVSLTAWLVLWLTGIRAVGLSPSEMTLVGIAPQFIEALRRKRKDMLTAPRTPTAGEFAEAIAAKASLPREDAITCLSSEDLVEWTRRQGALAEDTLRVLRQAQDAAAVLGHDYIGTEHLLLALRTTIPSVAAYLLKSLGVETEHIEKAIRKLSGSAGAAVSKRPATPRLTKAISDALEQARSNRHRMLETTDLLAALLRDPDTIAAEILVELGLDREGVQKAITMPNPEQAPQPDTRIRSDR